MISHKLRVPFSILSLMQLPPFQLERFFAKYEFTAPYLLCASDMDALHLSELLALADQESLDLWEQQWLGYTESQGHPLLRAEIAALYTKISAEQVLTLVPEEGIFIAMNCLLQPGDHVITTYPGYQSLYQIAKSIGAEVDHWIPEYQHGEGWKFQLERLEQLLRPETKLLVVNFPHNPTGATITQDELNGVIQLARERNCYLFSDEMYRLMEYDPAAKVSAACDLYSNAISLFGMSKSFALPGLRVGWLATQNEDILGDFAAFKDYTTICSSGPSEILSIMGLRAKEAILERNMKLTQANLAILSSFMTAYDHIFDWKQPLAGPISFPQLRIDEDIEIFCQKLVDEQGVLLLPSTVYEIPGKYVRLSYARKNMGEALERLGDFLEKHY